MKHTGWPLKPAILYKALMSSNRLVTLYVCTQQPNSSSHHIILSAAK
jgi:hypothetical protein